jgi:hypothetical protein
VPHNSSCPAPPRRPTHRHSPASACSICPVSSPARGAPRPSPISAPTSSRSNGRPARIIPAETTPGPGARRS